MFHLQPGTGLGFSGSREIALGLGGFDGIVVPTPFTPEPVHPPGMGPEARLRHKRILQEDDIIMALIVAFLDMKDK